jgi:hypothetical protein
MVRMMRSLQGTVENGNGATVFLIAKAVTGVTLDYFWVSCKPSGAFEFQDIGPGDYYRVALDHAGPLEATPPNVPDSSSRLPPASESMQARLHSL